jgi:hypothetical protein
VAETGLVAAQEGEAGDDEIEAGFRAGEFEIANWEEGSGVGRSMAAGMQGGGYTRGLDRED